MAKLSPNTLSSQQWDLLCYFSFFLAQSIVASPEYSESMNSPKIFFGSDLDKDN